MFCNMLQSRDLRIFMNGCLRPWLETDMELYPALWPSVRAWIAPNSISAQRVFLGGMVRTVPGSRRSLSGIAEWLAL